MHMPPHTYYTHAHTHRCADTQIRTKAHMSMHISSTHVLTHTNSEIGTQARLHTYLLHVFTCLLHVLTHTYYVFTHKKTLRHMHTYTDANSHKHADT